MQSKLKYGWILLLPIFFLTHSCDDNFLEETPTNFLNPAVFYQDLNQAEIALAGIYAGQQRIQGYSGGDAGVALIWGLLGTDETVGPPWAPAQRRDVFQWSLNPDNVNFRTIYDRHYQEINRANTVIDRVSAMSEDQINEEERNRILAEARSLRASFYFNLVRLWNRVPLITTERTNLEDLEFNQSSPEDIYGFITSELLAAIDVLEVAPGNNSGRISKGAAQALLGKVYLQMAGFPLKQENRYAAAAEQYQAVMASGRYRLLEDFQQVFDYQNELNDEMVWVVEHDGPSQSIDNSQNSNLGSYMGPAGNLDEGAGWGTAWAVPNFERQYDRNDSRRRVTFAYAPAPAVLQGDSTNAPNQFKPWKWQKPNPNTWRNDTPFDYPYIRYANVLLGFAEAHAQANGFVTDEALQAINQVRARARAGADPTTTNPPLTADLSLSEFIDEVLLERKKELAYEGHRKGDLLRTERLISTMQAFDASESAVWPGPPDPDPHEVFWPIPQSVMDLNPNYEQNPGY